MAITDIFVILGFVFLVSHAACSGLVRTLFWPIATIASGTLSIGVFLLSNNLWCTLATYILSAFLIRKLLPVFQKKQSPDQPEILPLSNRLIAVSVNLIWGAFLAFAIVLTISLLPLEKVGLGDVSSDILQSQTYERIAEIMVVPSSKTEPSARACPACDPQFETLIHSPITESLVKDPRIIKLISDPEFQEALRTKNVAVLAKNPVLQELRRDPVFLLRAVRLHMTMRASGKYK